MHSNNTKNLIRLATKLTDDPIAKLALEAVEVGIVVPSILRRKMEDAGYDVSDNKLKVLHQVNVHSRDSLIASGTSNSAGDALLHAVLGYLKEVEKACRTK